MRGAVALRAPDVDVVDYGGAFEANRVSHSIASRYDVRADVVTLTIEVSDASTQKVLRVLEPVSSSTDSISGLIDRVGDRAAVIALFLGGPEPSGISYRTLPRNADAATLARLYPGGPNEHRERFDAALDEAVAAGFVLEADADEIRGLARVGIQPSGFELP